MDKNIPNEVNASPGSHFEITLCQHGRGILSQPHRHPRIKLLYGLRGQLLVEIGSVSYPVNPGDLLLILADELHKISNPSKEDTAFWEIQYDREILYSASQSVADNQFLFSFTASGLMGQRLFERNALIDSSLSAHIEDLLEEYKTPGFCSDVSIRLSLCWLSLWFLRSWKTKDDEKDLISINDIYSMNLLQKIFTFVDQEYMNKIKMETIANQLNMSYHSFSKFFIAHTGKSFPSYVNEVRLTKSKILLTTTGMNITEIAMDVGYISTSHFIQRFKESNQMTPQQFRKEFNK